MYRSGCGLLETYMQAVCVASETTCAYESVLAQCAATLVVGMSQQRAHPASMWWPPMRFEAHRLCMKSNAMPDDWMAQMC